MPYTYKYIPASQKAINSETNGPMDDYISLFQQTLNEQFHNSSNWWKIEEETGIGTEEYVDTEVRISHLINAETGLKLGDDWKTIFFKDLDHATQMGYRYKFDDNVWLTINTEYLKNLTATCTVRRCNNTLRWIDEQTGAYYEEPCSIEYDIKEPRDYATTGSPFMTPGGFLHIWVQLNEKSGKIKQNQRFLFGQPGHWMCYKVIGAGINDFRNQSTYDMGSSSLLILDLTANFVNDELDDLTNGIADVNTNVYTLALNKSDITGAPGETFQLSGVVTYNGLTVSRTLEWETSSVGIATVSATGLVTFVFAGACTVTARIVDNPVSTSCAVTVSATPYTITDIRISPTQNYVLEGMQQVYTVYLYKDGAIQADTFTVTCNNRSVPDTSFRFIEGAGNGFTIENLLRCPSSYLTITCTTGALSKTFDIFLKGGW